MFNMMRIRAKLVMTLAIPLVAIIGISGVVVVLSGQQADDAARRSHEIEEEVALASSALGPGGVVSALQTERNSEVLVVIGIDPAVLGAGNGSLASEPVAREATDKAIANFKATVAASTPAVKEIYGPAAAEFDKLAGFRNDVDTATQRGLNSPISRGTFLNYSTIINALFDANSKVALAVDNSTLRNAAALIDLNARERERGSRVLYELGQVKLPLTNAEDALRVQEQRARQAETSDVMLRTATGAYHDAVQKAIDDPRMKLYMDSIQQLIDGTSNNFLGLLGPVSVDTWDVYAERDKAIANQLDHDAVELRNAAEQDRHDAEQRRERVILIGLFALIAATGITYLAARSISLPLRRLARNAEDMAANRLPDAVKGILETPNGEDVVLPELDSVPLGGGYEVNEVAVALNAVQTSAANLAVEQASMRRNIADSFVNLGRRNQNLLSRQIDSITQMEREESDPDTLQRLFSLDHLATRMRRNAESLLLLGGLEPHRQWSAPVPVIEVIRGAMGEVEDYQRITIRSLDDAMVRGSAAADVTHLVAELLENALRFSPPARDVEIVGRAADGDYTLAIVDAGLGMSEDDLNVANRRLSGGESFTVAPSRYLGHYVVGIQAHRLGVEVRLQNSPGSGVTARIRLADALAETPVPAPAAAPAVDEPVIETPVAHAVMVGSVVEETVEETVEAEAPVHEFVEEPAVERYVPPTPEPAVVEDTPVPTPVEEAPALTASGYKRRQRGANVPRTEVALARGTTQVDESDFAPENKADSVRSLLTGLQAGADRARAESSGAASNQEESR